MTTVKQVAGRNVSYRRQIRVYVSELDGTVATWIITQGSDRVGIVANDWLERKDWSTSTSLHGQT